MARGATRPSRCASRRSWRRGAHPAPRAPTRSSASASRRRSSTTTTCSSRSSNPQSDGIYRIGPRLEAYDRRGEFQWEARYAPSYEAFFDLTELNGWDHDASAEVTWLPNERTELRLSDHYVDYNRAVRFAQDVDVAAPGGDVETQLGRRGFKQNVALAASSRTASRRATWCPSRSRTSTTRAIRSRRLAFADENFVTSGSLNYLYDLGPRTQIGSYFQATFQKVNRNNDENRTDFYNLGFQLVHTFTPTVRT